MAISNVTADQLRSRIAQLMEATVDSTEVDIKGPSSVALATHYRLETLTAELNAYIDQLTD